jgi:hypothetical protein
MEAWCCKCKSKKEVKNSQEVKTKKGLRRLAGECSICGTKVSRILGK